MFPDSNQIGRRAPLGPPAWHFHRLIPAVVGVLCLVAPATPAGAQLPATAEVRVLAHPGSTPLSGARVEVADPGIAGTRTDPRGVAQLRGLPPGSHQVTASHPGFQSSRVTLVVETGRVTRVDLHLHPDPLLLEGIEVRGVGGGTSPPGATVLSRADAPPGARTLADLVALAPGVTLLRTGGPGSPVTVSLRGSRPGQVLVLVDGLPLAGGVGPEVDLATLPLDGVERVMILPGAQAGRFGPGAIGGVIAVETSTQEEGALGLEVGVGAFGERRARLHGATPVGPWNIEGQLRRETARGDFAYPVPAFRGGGTARRENARTEATGGEFTLARRTPLSRARIRVLGERVERGSPGTVVQPSRTGTQWQERGSVHALGERDHLLPGARILSGRLDGGLSLHRSEHADPDPPLGSAWLATARVGEGHLRGEVTLSGDGYRAHLGASGRHRQVEASSLASGAPRRIREGGLWIEAEAWGGGAGVPGAGPAGHPAGSFTPRITASLRADAHDLVRGLTLSPSVLAELSRGGTRLSAGWSSAFAPPALADLFFQEGVLVRPNPALAPERVRGEWSAALEQSGTVAPAPGGSLRGNLRGEAFTARVDGMVLWFPDHRFIWSPTNYDVRREGFGLTAGLTWQATAPPRTASPAPLASRDRASLQGRVERTRVRYAGGGLRGQMVYRPGWQGRIDAAFSPDLPGLLQALRLQATLEGVGPRRTVHGSELNTLEAFSTLDLAASLPVALGPRQGELQFVVRNATDTRAAFLADYPLPGRGWGVSLRIR